MYAVVGKLQAALFLGPPGNDIEFDLRNTLVSIQISSAVGQFVPCCRIMVVDPDRVFHNNGMLSDHLQFRLRLATGENFADVADYPMRYFSHSSPPTAGAQAYIIDGYFDYPLFMGATSSKPFTGTSVQVMADIANTCGMQTLLVAATADRQVWHPHNMRLAQYAKMVTTKGYISDTSCMRFSVGDDGVLRYLDITNLTPRDGAPQMVVARNNQGNGNYLVVESEPLTTTGIDNMDTGFGHRMMQSVIAGSDRDIDTARVKTDTTLLMNKLVKDQITEVGIRRSFAPIDPGNVNAKYVQATYQNQRLGNTWSHGSRILLNQRSNLQLLDPIDVRYDVPNTVGDPERFRSGLHLVAAKSIYVVGGNYYEAFHVLRNSVNLPPGSTP